MEQDTTPHSVHGCFSRAATQVLVSQDQTALVAPFSLLDENIIDSQRQRLWHWRIAVRPMDYTVAPMSRPEATHFYPCPPAPTRSWLQGEDMQKRRVSGYHPAGPNVYRLHTPPTPATLRKKQGQSLSEYPIH